jgi:methanogenic corrinoid protein MtbC1
MSGFQASLRNVFGAGFGAFTAQPTLYRAWPLFRLIPAQRSDHSPSELADMIEGQVIPRLMKAHPGAQPADPYPAANANDASAETTVSADEREAFLTMILGRTLDTACDHVATLMRGGAALSSIYAQLLAPSARQLADLWDRDRMSYADVTIGLGRLQQLIHGLIDVTPYNGDDDPQSASAYFAPRPGEEQTFGFYLMEEMFRWSGWRTSVETTTTHDAIRSSVRNYWFDMLCLSVTRDDRLEELRASLQAIRAASRNPDLFVLVSGAPFNEKPDLVDTVGADGAVSSGDEALHVGEEAVARRATA